MNRDDLPCRGTRAVLLAALILLAGCGGHEAHRPPAEGPAARADRLCRESILVDTHIDVPYRVKQEGDQDLGAGTEGGHFDHPRARRGGLDAAFMSIYIPASYQETGGGRELADSLIDMVEGFVSRWPEQFALARSPADVRRNFQAGLLSLPMGMENGVPIGDDLAALTHFRDRGIRYITLTHSENNQISDSSYAQERTWGGLSPFGREVIREMNRLGILVDVSHVSDDAFRQALEISAVPVIASHSSCRRFTPGWERNMSDEMIRALAAKGGVVQINFGSAFVDEAANQRSQAIWAAAGKFVEEHGLDWDSPEVRAEMERLEAEQPAVPVPLSRVADHIDHVVTLAGIAHVGIGSDFDGVTDLPEGLEDVSRYPALVEELLRRGYTDDDIRKILGGNLLRVWEEAERFAASPPPA